MAHMNLKQKAKLHNKHHLILTDARTGKVKQEGYAYNLILDQGFTRLIEWHYGQASTTASSSRCLFGTGDAANNRGWAGQTFTGTGTGTLAASRTAMFSFLSRKNNSYHDHEYNISTLTASHTRIAVWDETEHPSTNITEVALGVANDTGIVTHALIEDAEGNPITIAKGTLDILSIYSTVYIEISHDYGSNFGFVEGSPPVNLGNAGNWFLHWVANNAQPNGGIGDVGIREIFGLVSGTNNDAIDSTDAAVKAMIGGVFDDNKMAYNASEVGYDGSNKRIVVTDKRWGADAVNVASGIWEVGLVMAQRAEYGETSSTSQGVFSVFRSVLPLTGVWDGFTVTGEELGEGDGIETVYTTQWSPIKSGTLAVYVDSVLQTEGAEADYTVNLTTGTITFDAAPGAGLAVTADYDIDQIPKDANHVLDVSFTIQFADGNV